jgi:hypothetical protein
MMTLDRFLGIKRVEKKKEKRVCQNYIERIMSKNTDEKGEFIPIKDLKWENRSFCYPYCAKCPEFYACRIIHKYKCKIDYKKEAVKRCEIDSFCPLKSLE